MRVATGLALLSLVPALAGAQRQAPTIANALRDPSPARLPDVHTPAVVPTLGRAALATVGLAVVGYTGAMFDNAPIAIGGGLVANAFMAALPTWGSSCGFGARLRRAALWSTVGAMAYTSTVALSSQAGSAYTFLLIPLGASVGAGRCTSAPAATSSSSHATTAAGYPHTPPFAPLDTPIIAATVALPPAR